MEGGAPARERAAGVTGWGNLIASLAVLVLPVAGSAPGSASSSRAGVLCGK